MIAVPPTLSPLAGAVGWLVGNDRLMIAVPPTLSPLAAAVGGQSRESRDRPLVEESPTRGRRSRGNRLPAPASNVTWPVDIAGRRDARRDQDRYPWDQPVTESLVAGLLAGWGIAIPVGAVATYLVTLTARTSPAVGGAGALGVATADSLYALLAVVGGAAPTGLIAGIAGPLRWASAVVLVAVAAGIAWSAIRDHRAGRPGPGRVIGR